VSSPKDSSGILPTNPGDFAPFLEQLAAAKQALVNSTTVLQEVLQPIAGELSAKKLAFQQQVHSLGAAEIRKIARAVRIPKCQWAIKDELVTLMTETSPAIIVICFPVFTGCHIQLHLSTILRQW